jgi:hypothetical protein
MCYPESRTYVPTRDQSSVRFPRDDVAVREDIAQCPCMIYSPGALVYARQYRGLQQVVDGIVQIRRERCHWLFQCLLEETPHHQQPHGLHFGYFSMVFLIHFEIRGTDLMGESKKTDIFHETTRYRARSDSFGRKRQSQQFRRLNREGTHVSIFERLEKYYNVAHGHVMRSGWTCGMWVEGANLQLTPNRWQFAALLLKRGSR